MGRAKHGKMYLLEAIGIDRWGNQRTYEWARSVASKRWWSACEDPDLLIRLAFVAGAIDNAAAERIFTTCVAHADAPETDLQNTFAVMRGGAELLGAHDHLRRGVALLATYVGRRADQARTTAEAVAWVAAGRPDASRAEARWQCDQIRAVIPEPKNLLKALQLFATAQSLANAI